MCSGHGGCAHCHVWSPERGLRAQWLHGGAWASYLVSSDFCGSGGGPAVGELPLGDTCTGNGRVTGQILFGDYPPSFPLFWTIPLGELHLHPWWLHQSQCLAFLRCQKGRHTGKDRSFQSFYSMYIQNYIGIYIT